MVCYDQRRKLQCQVTSWNCVEEEWRKLDKVIRRGGISGGFKGYFKAYITPKGTMKILVNEPLPLQPW
jgi:hypothetical protein